MKIAVEVSIYPLHQSKISPPIEAAWEIFDKCGLSYEKGEISTLVKGEFEEVFDALKESFEKAVEFGDTNMSVTMTNI
ncbi:hypothetical protein GF312_09140 [Candidatus Poribacteria bacterium]|nr:hypothetical protein [Candidatus Poribacteria bacterium]